MSYYQLGVEETFRRLNTSEGGLTEEEAQGRLRQYGPNKLAEEKKTSKVAIFLHQFTSPLIYIILIAAVITAFYKDFVDAVVIMVAVVLNAIIGYVQENKAEESVRALKRLVVPRGRVLRGGREREIESEHLVPGDIVLLASGAKVPADLRLFQVTELRIEEAMITGESLPSDKIADPIGEEYLTPGDQRNMAFMGTVVVAGRAKGLVVATGGGTLLGEIASEVKEVSVAQAPLQEKIVKFARLIAIFALCGTAVISAVGLLIGVQAREMFKIAVAAMVATVPEGLPVVATIVLAVGVSRMAKRNAIVRRLPAVETLGSATVICTDKTGTLTQNEMTVRVIYDGEETYEATGTGYDPRGEIKHGGQPIDPAELQKLRMALRIGMLCNESSLYEEDGQIKVNGDPTEAALIVSAKKGGLVYEQERDSYPQLGMIPFESDRGYMATLHRSEGARVVFVKGAPERILDLCTECELKKAIETKAILSKAHELGEHGLRVIALAYKEVSPQIQQLSPQVVEGDLVLAGLQGIMDPPRPEAAAAVKACKEAGIRVVMITGDHPTTASAIGGMLGIGEEGSQALTGRVIEGMSDEELFDRVRDVSIYARVSPHHKLRIVQQLIRRGEIVAVTGDGVNDAPALKAAHIGAAMGRSGTDVAKEAADMILADDNFVSIFNAVEEGRIVFDNIRKVTLFLIPLGFAALFSMLATMVLGIPIPYLAAQLLWINLVTSGLQDISLALEPGEKGISKRPPRSPKEGIMSRLMLERTLLVGLLISAGVLYNFLSSLNSGDSMEKARTIAITTVVFFQFFQAWNSRSLQESIFRMNPFGNPYLFFAVAAAFIAHLMVLYIPGLQWIFRTVPLSGGEWLRIAAVTATIVIAVELHKWLKRRRSV